jgi:hypothetical protein
MKRHQVMDLYHANETEEFGEWHELDYNYKNTHPQPSGRGCKVKVKTSHNEYFAYYYEDKCQWLEDFRCKPCYFWNCKTKEPIENVTHWKEVREPNENAPS